jgi:glutamate racemase
MNIGVFDSGLGGLSILKELVIKLPSYNYVYFGDNANVPYGDKSSSEIYKLTLKAVNFLFSQDCELIVTACNTVSAVVLREIQDNYLKQKYPSRRILGVVVPVVETIAEKKYKKIGIIGTLATVNSEVFVKKIKVEIPTCEVFQQACPLLVPQIEKGLGDTKGLGLLLDKYLTHFKKSNIEALVLGCTHYGLIKKEIKRYFDNSVKIIDEGEVCAEKLGEYLLRHPEIEEKLSRNGLRKYYVSKLVEGYEEGFRGYLGGIFTKRNKLEIIIK